MNMNAQVAILEMAILIEEIRPNIVPGPFFLYFALRYQIGIKLQTIVMAMLFRKVQLYIITTSVLAQFTENDRKDHPR